MLVNLFENASLLDATKDMISAIDNSDFSIDHIVIVPDKFSLQAEKLLLTLLPSKALFNVRVMGITMLVNEILSKLNLDSELLSPSESLLLTQKAIENVKDELVTSKKSNIVFCYEINKIISQLKSSLVGFDDLNVDAKGLTGGKYHDLMLIYKEYERLRDKDDVNTRLKLATTLLKDSKIFKDSKFYFAMFDAFTKEGYSLIKALIQVANEINLSIAKSLDIGNDYIYEKDIYQKLVNLSAECGVGYRVVEKKGVFSKQKNALLKGVYSYQKVRCENQGFYTLYSSSNLSEEVSSVAKIIFSLIHQGFKYNDIVVMTSDLTKYQLMIENVFSMFGIPYFIDTSISADQTLLVNLIFTFFAVILSGYSQDSLISLFSNFILGKNNELIEKCQRMDIDNKFKFKKYLAEEFAYSEIIEKLENCKKSEDYSLVIREIITRVKESYNGLLETLDNQYLKEKNINIQVEEIIEESINLIEIYQNDEISLKEYFKKFQLLLSFKKISTVPTFVDGVLIGDATTSSSLNCRVLIIMGGQNLPQTSGDNGYLSDEDLSLNFTSKQIEPTIRMINRRNRFKLFSLLSLADENLVITYQVLNEEGKKNELPTFISNLNEIFNVEPIKCSDVFDNEENLVALGNRKNFINEFYKSLTEEQKKMFEIDNQKTFINKKEIKTKGKELFFDKNKIRVTQIENYFSCPFKHFVSYGLKLKENEKSVFEANNIGSICHRGAELLVKSLIENNFDLNIDIEKFIDKNFLKILKDEGLEERFSYMSEKKSLERYLKNQLKVICQDIVREMSVSSFRPKYLEMKFDNMTMGKKNNIHLIGKADRIDECGDYFRIIDYKTGSTGNFLKELYYGDKLQLFLYQKEAKDKLKKVCGGVYYFNAKFDYAKNDEDKKLFKGLTRNDDDVINMIDREIEEKGKSGIISISLASEKNSNKFKGSAIAKENLNVYENYAKKVADRAVDEIYGGYIEAKPDEDACKYCKFGGICGFEKQDGKRNKDLIGDFKSEE